MSVVDNVLLVHQVDSKVVILYDIFADSRAPISAPLPLLLRGFPGLSIDVRSSKQDRASIEADVVPGEAIVYGDGWKFLVPDLICDHVNKLMWKIHIDLEVGLPFLLFLLSPTYLSCKILALKFSFITAGDRFK